MTRYKAFAIHVAISAAVITAITGLFIWLWFPLPHFITEGGWRGLRLIAVIDCIIGPVITLIIYNPKKSRRELLLDLTAIALMQVMAMGAGLFTVASKRVVASVYSDGSFYNLGADEALQVGGKLLELIEESETVPAYVVVDLPDGLDERQTIRREAVLKDKPVYSRTEFMIPLDEGARQELSSDDVAPTEMPLIANKAPLEKYLQDSGSSYELNYFIRTVSLYGSYITVLSRKDFKLTGWIPDVYDKEEASKATP